MEINELEEQVKLKKQIELIEENAKKYLSKEAVNRFGNLRLAHPDKALRVCGLILEAVNRGQIKDKLNDEEFLGLLRLLEEPKKEFHMRTR